MLNFTDICLMSDNVPALVTFYEKLFGAKAQGNEVHSVLTLSGFRIAIYSKEAAANDRPELNYSGSGNDCIHLAFTCEDAETEFERIKALKICTPSEPKIWPWGAKSFYLKDLDGNILVIRSWLSES